MRRTKIKIDGSHWCEIAIELRDDPTRPVLSITGAKGSILTRAAARAAARDYWREFLDENPAELVRMQKEFGVRTAAGAARKVVEIDGEFHGLDVHRELGDQILITESCGQIVEDLARWFPFAVPWLPFHLNDMRAGCEHQRAGGWQSCRGYHPAGESCPTPDLAFPVGRRYSHHEDRAFSIDKHAWIAGINEDTIQIPCPTCGRLAQHAGPVAPWPQLLGRGVPTHELPAGLSHNARCINDALMVPCPVCGYKYGSRWLYEPIPLAILLELRAFLARE